MKKFLKILPLIVLICALVCAFVACDEPEPPKNAVIDEQGVAYRLNADSSAYDVIGFSSQSVSDVVIPERLENKPVVSIQTGAFHNNDDIKSVSLPSSVKVISDGAFSDCLNLETVSFGENSNITTIGMSAFKDCINLSSVSLPSDLVTIGKSAFEGCTLITEMEIPATVQTLSDLAFRDCVAIKKVTFEEGSTLTEIGEEAFCGCTSLSSVTLPDGLTDIDKSAFFGCDALKAIELPDGLVNIQKYAFYGCKSLTEIDIPSAVETIGESAFNNCQELEKVTFGENGSITKIEAQTFENCWELTSIAVPNGVTDIEEMAFAGCESLKTITFGEQSELKTINSKVFVGCDSLKEVALPKSLASIKDSAFEACKKLTTVTVPDDSMLVDIGARAFYNCDNLTTVTFGESGVLREVKDNAFYDCDRLMTVDFGEYSTLKKIGQKAFYHCDALFSFTIPIDVTEIGTNAFSNCYRLVEINDLSVALNIEKGSSGYGGVAKYAKEVVNNVAHVSKIVVDDDGYVTYTNGSNVSLVGYIGNQTDLVIPLEITEVNGFAFYRNAKIKSLDFERNTRLYTILASAFESCSVLESIKIPETVMFIGDNAFKNCVAVKAVYYDAKNCEDMTETTDAFFGVGKSSSGVVLTVGRGVEKLPDYLFYSSETAPRIKNINFSEDGLLQEIGDYAFANNRYFTSLNIPATLVQMGVSAFENTSVTYLTFENECGLYTIPENAFYNCTKLRSVDFGDLSNVAEISAHAFENCTALRSINFGDSSSLNEIGESSFKNCVKMTSFELGVNVSLIGDDAFYNCYRLTEIIYDAGYLGVTIGSENNGGIAKYALVVHDGDESLVTTDDDGYVVLSKGNEKILVSYVGGDTELVIPSSVTNVNALALCDMDKLVSVKFATNSALDKLGDKVFLNCTELKNVEIPENTVVVGEGVFNGCVALDTVYYNAVNCTGIQEDTVLFDGTGNVGIKLVVGSNVKVIPSYLCCATKEKFDFKIASVEFASNAKCTTIGDYAFAGEETISELNIPDSVINVGKCAFKDCTGIVNLNLNQTSELKVIGAKAFENCSSIVELNLPGKVWNIASNAFDGMGKGLLSINVASENTVYHAQGNCLIKTSNNTLVLGCRNSSIPDYIVTIADGAFKNCTELKNIVIPESVKSIGSEAFYYCTSVTEIIIEGETLESIGHNAFVYCLKLQKITLPESLKSIGSHAFLYCKSLNEISYAGTVEEWNEISLGEEWNYQAPITVIKCSDKDIEL